MDTWIMANKDHSLVKSAQINHLSNGMFYISVTTLYGNKGEGYLSLVAAKQAFSKNFGNNKERVKWIKNE